MGGEIPGAKSKAARAPGGAAFLDAVLVGAAIVAMACGSFLVVRAVDAALDAFAR